MSNLLSISCTVLRNSTLYLQNYWIPEGRYSAVVKTPRIHSSREIHEALVECSDTTLQTNCHNLTAVSYHYTYSTKQPPPTIELGPGSETNRTRACRLSHSPPVSQSPVDLILKAEKTKKQLIKGCSPDQWHCLVWLISFAEDNGRQSSLFRNSLCLQRHMSWESSRHEAKLRCYAGYLRH